MPIEILSVHITIIGSGAMGSLFGGLLAAAGNDVLLYDVWAEHIETIQRDGLRMDRPDGSSRTIAVDATSKPKNLQATDLAIIFTKVTNTATALETVEPHLPKVDVMTIQNGFGNAEIVSEFIDDDRIIAGVTESAADLEGPGHITHTGTGITTFGRFFANNDQKTETVGATFRDADIEPRVVDDPQDAIWQKALVILAFNPISALTHCTVGEIWDQKQPLVEEVIEEVSQVADAEGRDISEDPVGHVARVAANSSAHHPSMYQDILADRSTEIEYLSGEIVRRAAEHDIAVPVNETLTNLVRLRESISN